MSIHKRVLFGVAVLLATLLGPVQAVGAEDEGVRIGVVQEVDQAAGIVVIDGTRYRSYGRRVQPPPEVPSESEGYESRPFERGLIVQFTTLPGNPPIIERAWSLDQ